MGRFVRVSVEAAQIGVAAAKAVVGACPVDIFRLDTGRLVAEESRVDECILCGRCVALAPQAVSVTRAYGTRRPLVPTDERDD